MDEDDFRYFTTDDPRPYQPRAKRRRLSDATMERRDARIANTGWKRRNAVKFRWHRSKDISRERKDEFHEREKTRVDQLWVECMKGISYGVVEVACNLLGKFVVADTKSSSSKGHLVIS